jgi:hypothetical protein
MLLSLLILVGCSTPPPTEVPTGSAIEGKPSMIEDEGPTMGEVVDADASIPAPGEAPSRGSTLDPEAAAALGAAGKVRRDTSKSARENFNPISVPEEGSGLQEWEWPFKSRDRAIDLDGDGELDIDDRPRRVDLNDMVDIDAKEQRAKMRERRSR